MKKFLHKILQIFVCVLPVIITLGIQIAISIPMSFYYFSALGLQNKGPGHGQNILEWIKDSMLNPDFSIYVTVAWGIVSLIVFAIWYKRTHDYSKDIKVKDSFNLYSIGGLGLLVIGLQFAIHYFYEIAAKFFPTAFSQYNELMSFENSSAIALLIMVIYGVLIAPIHEEFLTRGVILRFAEKAMPFWIANIFQAALFGLLHLNVVQSSYAFIVGVVLGYIYHYARNIWIPILFHISFNLFGFTVELASLDSAGISAQVLLGLIGCVIAISGVVLFKTHVKLRDE